jgi:hypothetical protein
MRRSAGLTANYVYHPTDLQAHAFLDRALSGLLKQSDAGVLNVAR